MKKTLFSIIITIILFTTILQSNIKVNAISKFKEDRKDIEIKYKDYSNCRIRTKDGEVDGKAFLFPGFIYSWPGSDSNGVDVEKAIGVLIGDGSDWTNHIYFNDDQYYMNWKKAYIISFNGFFYNYFYSPWRVFEIDGTAKFVRLYYI